MRAVALLAATYFMVGGWPYGIEDIVAKAGYAGALLILLITPAIWAFPTSLMVSELSSALPQDGGFYVWASRALGPFWGFQEAWLTLVGSIFDMALYPTLFLGYLGHFAPSMTAGGRGLAIGIALIAAAAVWNLLGARIVGEGSVAFGLVLLAPFAVLTGYAVWHRGSTALGAPPRHFDYLAGILVAMWNYMGWDNASTVAGEVERPQSAYPLALGGAVSLVTLNYALPIAAVALTGLDAGRWSTGGWADISREVLGSGAAASALAIAITIGGMLGAFGTLNALTLSMSRLPAAMADDAMLPKIFGRRSANTGVPWVGVLACAACWALCLGLTFTKLVMLDVLITGLSILLEFASLVALRVREPELPRPYRVPGGLVGAVGIGVAPAVLLVITAARTEAEPVGPINALMLGLILIGSGVVAYLLGERIRKSL